MFPYLAAGEGNIKERGVRGRWSRKRRAEPKHDPCQGGTGMEEMGGRGKARVKEPSAGINGQRGSESYVWSTI